MLRRILEHLAQGESRTQTALARELGASPRELEAMLERLAELGYVESRPMCLGGGPGCAACSERASCRAPAEVVRVWTLTGKGRTVGLLPQ